MNKCNRLDTRRLLARNEVVDTLIEYNQRNAKEFIESYRELRKREAELIALGVL
jgi:hypothetical protein